MKGTIVTKLIAALMLLAFVGSITPASAAELEIVNASGKAINHVVLARKGQRKWGPARLAGQDAIVAGSSRVINEIDPAVYDLRLSDEDDRSCEIYTVAITRTKRLELTDAKLDECTRESH